MHVAPLVAAYGTAHRFVFDTPLPLFFSYPDAHIMMSGEYCLDKLSFVGDAELVTTDGERVEQNAGCWFARASNETVQFLEYWYG